MPRRSGTPGMARCWLDRGKRGGETLRLFTHLADGELWQSKGHFRRKDDAAKRQLQAESDCYAKWPTAASATADDWEDAFTAFRKSRPNESRIPRGGKRNGVYVPALKSAQCWSGKFNPKDMITRGWTVVENFIPGDSHHLKVLLEEGVLAAKNCAHVHARLAKGQPSTCVLLRPGEVCSKEDRTLTKVASTRLLASLDWLNERLAPYGVGGPSTTEAIYAPRGTKVGPWHADDMNRSGRPTLALLLHLTDSAGTFFVHVKRSDAEKRDSYDSLREARWRSVFNGNPIAVSTSGAEYELNMSGTPAPPQRRKKNIRPANAKGTLVAFDSCAPHAAPGVTSSEEDRVVLYLGFQPPHHELTPVVASKDTKILHAKGKECLKTVGDDAAHALVDGVYQMTSTATWAKRTKREGKEALAPPAPSPPGPSGTGPGAELSVLADAALHALGLRS